MAGFQAAKHTAMIAGHFGFAAIVKSRERAVPLWALMLATQWLDVLFVPLFVIGIEHLEPVAGTSGGYGSVIIHADYTHSLVGAALIAILSALLAALVWNRRAAVVLGAMVFSHWLLDLVVHRGDMALLPGNLGDFARVGFGLWKAPVVSAVVELALVLAGSLLYFAAAARAERAAGGRAHAAYVAAGLMALSGVVTLMLNVFGY
ncbi:MAG TPA: hypothetical protein VGJ29_10895 [Vicinamibacterales bacterium]